MLPPLEVDGYITKADREGAGDETGCRGLIQRNDDLIPTFDLHNPGISEYYWSFSKGRW